MKKILLLFLFIPSLAFAQKQGQSFLDSLLRELPQTRNDTNKVKMLDLISIKFTRINTDSGIRYGTLALELAEKLGWEKGIAISYRYIGAGYTDKSDYSKGMEYYFKALKINEILNDSNEIARNLSVIGSNYRYEQNYDKALEYGFRSLEVCYKSGNIKYLATQLGNIGTIYADMKNGPKSVEYNFKALVMLEQLNDSLGIARNLGNIGEFYTDHGDYRLGLQYLFVSQKFARSINFKRGMAFNIGNMGSCYLGLATDDSTLYKQVDSSVAPRKCKSLAVNSPGLLDSITQRDKAAYLKIATEYLEKSVLLAREINSADVFVRYSSKLSEVYSLTGRYKQALEIYIDYAKVKDSLITGQN